MQQTCSLISLVAFLAAIFMATACVDAAKLPVRQTNADRLRRNLGPLAPVKRTPTPIIGSLFFSAFVASMQVTHTLHLLLQPLGKLPHLQAQRKDAPRLLWPMALCSATFLLTTRVYRSSPEIVPQLTGCVSLLGAKLTPMPVPRGGVVLMLVAMLC